MRSLLKIVGLVIVGIVGFYLLPLSLVVLYMIKSDDDSWVFDLDRMEFVGAYFIAIVLTIAWVWGLSAFIDSIAFVG